MTNEEKAREIQANDVCCVWNGGCPNVRNGAMKMAQWKDEQLESKLMQIIILAQQGYTSGATDEMILKHCKEIINENYMNTILQKRIEEAATFLFKQRGLDKESCRQAMGYILSNQWISVEEALPEKIKDKNYSEYVLVRQEYYEHEYHVIARYDYGFNMWVSTMYFKPEFITHWMPILSLKGGEK